MGARKTRRARLILLVACCELARCTCKAKALPTERPGIILGDADDTILKQVVQETVVDATSTVPQSLSNQHSIPTDFEALVGEFRQLSFSWPMRRSWSAFYVSV